jgi:hypothetical protein
MLVLTAVTIILATIYFFNGNENLIILAILIGYGAGITFIALLIALIVSAWKGR